jgi:hypothetical protein
VIHPLGLAGGLVLRDRSVFVSSEHGEGGSK